MNAELRRYLLVILPIAGVMLAIVGLATLSTSAFVLASVTLLPWFWLYTSNKLKKPTLTVQIMHAMRAMDYDLRGKWLYKMDIWSAIKGQTGSYPDLSEFELELLHLAQIGYILRDSISDIRWCLTNDGIDSQIGRDDENTA